jgi:dTDP-4-dehydrorhamnose 3,5-epimerase
MHFSETPIAGAHVIDLEPRRDDRGFFARVWCRDEFASHGLSAEFVQCNDAFSARRGTLRGLHYQVAPHAEAKLIQCVRGAIFDVVVDLRPGSPTFRQWFGTELSAENHRMMYVPQGCAHGYLTLEDATEIVYPVTHAYRPSAERGVRWDDPQFGIAWPRAGSIIVSDKDRQWPDYRP